MKRLKLLKNNKSGFTFIEFMVCFAILMLLISVASFSLSLTPATQAKEVAQNINSMISRTKAGTLVRTGDVYMKVYMSTGGEIIVEYYEDGQQKEKHNVSGKDKVYVRYTDEDGDEVLLTAGGTALYLGFDRRTTGFVSLKDAAARAGVSSGKDSYCETIQILAGDADNPVVEYTITTYKTTGTHTSTLA